ncbi:hypothetical protein LINGRAHAP2_LOCUS7794 [Linum grandiflorum]
MSDATPSSSLASAHATPSPRDADVGAPHPSSSSKSPQSPATAVNLPESVSEPPLPGQSLSSLHQDTDLMISNTDADALFSGGGLRSTCSR